MFARNVLHFCSFADERPFTDRRWFLVTRPDSRKFCVSAPSLSPASFDDARQACAVELTTALGASTLWESGQDANISLNERMPQVSLAASEMETLIVGNISQILREIWGPTSDVSKSVWVGLRLDESASKALFDLLKCK